MTDSITLPGKGQTVLISGGSIAGPAIAWWLNKYGFETTIVERWHELRPGGQNIDVRGVGRDIITKMGLFDAVKARNTTEAGFEIVNASGKALVQIPAMANGPTAELEILRGDFAGVLYDATKEGTRYIFGDSIARIDDEVNGSGDKEGKATVTFHSSRKEEFDIVIIADGVRSRTRKMIFGDEVEYKRLGSSIAYATIPRIPTDTQYWAWYTSTGRRTINTRPDPYGTTRACFSYMTTKGFGSKDASERISLLRNIFQGAGWETQRILDQLDDTPDLYCEDLCQVKAPRYSSGRVVMIGDAAYCASPISGMGTTLSLSGAYILAAELALSPEDHQVAFRKYEEKMRPIAIKAQDIPSFIPGIVHPQTWWGLAILSTVVTVVGGLVSVVIKIPWPKFLVDKMMGGEDKSRAPEYNELEQYQ